MWFDAAPAAAADKSFAQFRSYAPVTVVVAVVVVCLSEMSTRTAVKEAGTVARGCPTKG